MLVSTKVVYCRLNSTKSQEVTREGVENALDPLPAD